MINKIKCHPTPQLNYRCYLQNCISQQLDENQRAFHVINNVEIHNSQILHQHVTFYDVASTLNRKNSVKKKEKNFNFNVQNNVM